MAIDIRATCTCSLGTLISASINDDYIQGSGLIKVRGQCVVKGVITPDIGTVVTFAYSQGGVTTAVPRKLRVLSSFADPFRQTTTVELGCKLTYLQDLKDPIKWDPKDDPEWASVELPTNYVGTMNFKASSIMAKCLEELGITASSNPLTNEYRREAWDYSPGYVAILNDLLVSECYCGYLSTNEVLQVFSLAQDGGTGPVLDQSNLIDIGPLNFGELPGESVIVTYDAWRFADTQRVVGTQEDIEEEVLTSGFETTTGSTTGVTYLSYQDEDGNPQLMGVNTLATQEEMVTYEVYNVKGPQPPEQIIRKGWGYYGERIRLPVRRELYEEETSVLHLASVYEEYLREGVKLPGFEQLPRTTTETFTYDEQFREVRREVVTIGSSHFLIGGMGLKFVFDNISYSALPQRTVILGITVTQNYYIGDYRKTVTTTYVPWCTTQPGQQAIAVAAEDFETGTEVDAFILTIISGRLVCRGTSIQVEKSNNNRQEAPQTYNEQSFQLYSDYVAQIRSVDRGGLLEQSEEIELALGSATAQRRIELRMPLAPDDSFTVNSWNGISSYIANYQGAREKARQFGRVQNKLLLGNRNGMNVQVAPSALPTTPFSPVFVSTGGYVALYRTNGTSYTMDANGIVASSDLLFMGGVGTV